MNNVESLHKQINILIKISNEDQIFLLKYFSKLPLSMKIEIEKNKKKTFHSLREKFTNISNDILSYAAHILSIKATYSFEKKFTNKQFDNMSLEEIQDITMIKLRREEDNTYIKQSVKRNKLLHYWAVVKMYRNTKPKPYSFETISQKLKKHYNFTVSHNTIYVLWRELESENV